MFAISNIMDPILDARELGQRIRRERVAQGRTQSWVATLVGCRRQTIADLEAGRNVGINQLVRAASALGKALAIVDAPVENAEQGPTSDGQQQEIPSALNATK
jgi:transcriptional regulator with XRE-family HTH domain